MAPVSSASNAASGSPTTSSLQDLSAAAAAIALDMKPKVELAAVPTQKIKKLVRRNASDKLKLIQMVHDNPILWDSRLPNFKGAEEEKNRAWEHIGREFNAPGRRVARAFKSLRESYRRELAHVKIMGNGFKPKWSLYEAMDFLRDVIRERKGGSHASDSLTTGLTLSAFAQHLHHNNNNNNLGAGANKSALKLAASSYYDTSAAALNLSKGSPLNIGHDDFYYHVKRELDLSTGGGVGGGVGGDGGAGSSSGSSTGPLPQPMPAHQAHQAHNDSRVSSTRNDSSAAHQTSFDDMDDNSLRSGDEDGAVGGNASDEVEELEAIDADFPYPLILDSNSPRSLCNGSMNGGGVAGGDASGRKRRRKAGDDDEQPEVGDDADDYEDQMLQQHRHLRQQQNGAAGGGGGLDLPPPQTVREVLNSKFCGFISAKLNSMEDSEADNLMNRILLLLVQMQQAEAAK
ncbi:uncharacterized protein LOC115632487 [Scaptodrosophila lebanonensis]|uniref:Uncharacterized protein LOC115632487 n=1 Tax=Drosophila lebanonensis TaxID=7225 RepID=A0A6J2UBT0_DROLE|nr:uncharacterized protein LOC115632487 [Scaptodrosophila lebanonensis]